MFLIIGSFESGQGQVWTLLVTYTKASMSFMHSSKIASCWLLDMSARGMKVVKKLIPTGAVPFRCSLPDSLKQNQSGTRKPSPAYSPYSLICLLIRSSTAIGFISVFRDRNRTATSLAVMSGCFRKRSL